MEKCIITIRGQADGVWYDQEPIVPESITWRTKRKGEPSTLEFTCIKDDLLSFQEGSEATFQYGNRLVFSGYVFEKSRNKDQHISVKCYDRTRYLKNKYSHVFTNLRADQIIQRIADDLQLKVGKDGLANTGYVIPKLAQSNLTLLDMIQNALDLTTQATGIVYTFYDEFGYLYLKPLDDMTTDYLLDAEVAEDFDYTTSIDRNTYNAIVVKVEGEEPIVVYDETKKDAKGNVIHQSSMASWGYLQYETESTTKELAYQKGQALLRMYNNVSCGLGINGAFGDINVRGGAGIYIDLSFGDSHGDFRAKREENATYYMKMLVDEATHTFENGHHTMDLTLIDGRGFYG